jgi:hypothetical protein
LYEYRNTWVIRQYRVRGQMDCHTKVKNPTRNGNER